MDMDPDVELEAVKTVHYDVVVIGAGVAGLSSARHMLLKIPELRSKRIAIIDPRSTRRNNEAEDYKVGESTVEISAMFFAKELELQDYLIENHPPKFSLQFHWPKSIEKTDTMDDYHSSWATKNPEIQSFQLNRAKLEKDLIQIVIKQGAVYYHGRVKDVDIAPGDARKTIDVQLLSDEDRFEDQKPIGRINITTDYIVDCSGRNFIVGSRTENVLRDPKMNLFGLQNGSTWVRVKGVDKSLFDFASPNVTCSWYYATNHFFGPGYWLWMIPIERGSHDFSIGVSYHKDKYDPSQFNSYEKFMSFLENNQKILYNLISSGEIIDFHRWPKLPHTSKTFFSEDNWAVMGDAAAIFDPFYSTGMVMIALEVECNTEILKYKLAGDKMGADLRRKNFDNFIRNITQVNNHLIKDHCKHLGNASAMSWRIYLESLVYFGLLVPLYIGKYHLCPTFTSVYKPDLSFRDRILRTLDYVVDNDINVGFMDNHYGGNQLWGSYCPLSSWDVDHAVSNCMYGHKRLNLHKYFVWSHFYQMTAITALFKRVYGWKFIFNSDYQWLLAHTVSACSFQSVLSIKHQIENYSKPTNEYYANRVNEFTTYEYKHEAIPWKE
eukprot:gene6790-7893_t